MDTASIIDDLKSEVERLARPEGRVVGTPGHDSARRYLLQRLAEIGLEPFAGSSFDLPYALHGLTFHNLVGIVRGTGCSRAGIVVGAHYDSAIEASCADDNAAAVAVALAVAVDAKRTPSARDVIVALFDAEEPPYYLGAAMGSVRFYHDHRPVEGFHAAVIMDLVGHDVPLPVREPASALPHFSSLLFLTGAESHVALPEIVRQSARDPELPVVAVENRLIGDMSDHAVFRAAGVPYLFLSCGRWEHYHRPTDVPGVLNYRKMARIVRYVCGLIRAIAAVKLDPGAPPDTTDLTIELLHKALEPGLPFLLNAIGLDRLKTQSDIDLLASRMQAYFRI